MVKRMKCGNVFFVLIAVVVMQWSTSSVADTDLAPAHPMQRYAESIRNSITKNMLAYKIPLDQIRFNSPDQFDLLRNKRSGVFHPDGGQKTYQNVPMEYMANGQEGRWLFNAELNIIGREEKGNSDIAAYVIGISEETCRNLNKILKVKTSWLPGIPKIKSNQKGLYSKNNMIDDHVSEYELPKDIRPDLDVPQRAWAGCFADQGQYIYYHVLATR